MKTLLFLSLIIVQLNALDRVGQFDREINELRESISTLQTENTLLKSELSKNVKTPKFENKHIVNKPIIKEKIIYIEKPIEKIVYKVKKIYIDRPSIEYIEKPVVKVVKKIVEKNCSIKNSFPELLMKY